MACFYLTHVAQQISFCFQEVPFKVWLAHKLRGNEHDQLSYFLDCLEHYVEDEQPLLDLIYLFVRGVPVTRDKFVNHMNMILKIILKHSKSNSETTR